MRKPKDEHERVRAAFGQVFERPCTERAEALAEACGNDSCLRAEVERLLALHDRSVEDGFLAEPILLTSLGPVGDPVDLSAPLPESIGRYRVTARLGAGSVGMVYRATSPPPAARDVAVKVLRRSAPGSALERFRFEQQALAGLDHPGIGRILDSGFTDDSELFAVFEFIDGLPITAYAEQHGLSWRERLGLLLQACDAVQHAHQRGVIHRDLKPGNLLVTQSGGRAAVKVIDFGVSKLLPPQPETTATEQGLLVGTLAYMAPEVLAGHGAADTRIDVYALGVVLFELLEGRHPFQERLRSLPELVRAIGDEGRPAPRGTYSGNQRDVDAIIRRATHADPEQRYSTPEHLADDLQRLLADRPVEARRPSLVGAAVKLARRRSKTVAATALCLVVAALLVVQAVTKGREARAHRSALQQTVGSLTSDVLSEIAETSGTAGARVQLAELLHERLEGLRAKGADSPEIRLSHVQVLDVLSDAHLEERRLDEAESIRRRVKAELESLLADQPGDRSLRRRLARADVRIGDTYVERGDTETAQSWYEAAHTQIVRLAEEDPRDMGVRDDLCWSLERLAALQWKHGLRDEAIRLADERLERAQRLLARQPGDAVAIHNAASAHCQRSYYAWRSGDHELGAEHAAAAAGLSKQLCELEPTRVAYRMVELSAHRQWARELVALEQNEQARPLVETLHARSRALELMNPSNWRVARIARQIRQEFPLDDP